MMYGIDYYNQTQKRDKMTIPEFIHYYLIGLKSQDTTKEFIKSDLTKFNIPHDILHAIILRVYL